MAYGGNAWLDRGTIYGYMDYVYTTATTKQKFDIASPSRWYTLNSWFSVKWPVNHSYRLRYRIYSALPRIVRQFQSPRNDTDAGHEAGTPTSELLPSTTVKLSMRVLMCLRYVLSWLRPGHTRQKTTKRPINDACNEDTIAVMTIDWHQSQRKRKVLNIIGRLFRIFQARSWRRCQRSSPSWTLNGLSRISLGWPCY
jgi:hypothetical protein